MPNYTELIGKGVSTTISAVETIGNGKVEDFGPGIGGTKTSITTTIKGLKDSVPESSGGGKSIPEDDPSCKSKGITNAGIIKASNWKAALDAAVLTLNTTTSLKMAKLQRDIGRAYQELAEEQRAYYNNRYKPLELSLTQEAFKLKKYDRDKEKLITGQMLISSRTSTAGKIDKALSCTGRYCTGQRAAIMNDQLLEQSVVESLTAGLAHRYVDKDEITHNNLRWEKREQVLKIGRDIPTQAVSYASMAAGIFGSLGKQAGKAAEGAMEFLAYGRGETQYPERRQPITYPVYYFEPTKLELPKINKPKVYNKTKEPEQTIKLSG